MYTKFKVKQQPISRVTHDVFISYNWESKEQVKSLFDRFNRLGFSCWFNVQKKNERVIEDHQDQRIRDCKVFLPCVTKKYAESEDGRHEVNLADRWRKPIIPLLLERLNWPSVGPYMDDVFGPTGPVFAPLLYIKFIDPVCQITWCCANFDELCGQLNSYYIRPSERNRNELESIHLSKTSESTPLLENISVEYCINGFKILYKKSVLDKWQEIQFEHFEKITDVAPCRRHHRLYAYGDTNKTIYRILDNGRGQADKWLSIRGKNYHTTLSVTSDDRVLLVADEPPILDIYGSDALLLHTVQLPSNMVEPQHAVETPSGNFIISHGRWKSLLHRVLEVRSDGHVVWSYGNERGVEDGLLDFPEHVTVDARGRVYVSECGDNNRVIVLDSTLSACRVLVTYDEESIDNVEWVIYSDDTKQLLVGRSPGYGGFLDAYEVTDTLPSDGTVVRSREANANVKKDIFISYQWSNQKEAKELYRRLTEDLGFSCWLDVKQMGGGTNLYYAIDSGIRNCKVFLSCTTAKYCESFNCLYEVRQASSMKKPVIPLLFDVKDWPPADHLRYINANNQFPCQSSDVRLLVGRLAELNVTGNSIKIDLETLQANHLTRLNDDGEAVWGVAQLLDRIYILHSTEKIAVYDSETFVRFKDIGFSTEKEYCGDIAVCVTHKRLYVSGTKVIWLVMYNDSKVVEWLSINNKNYSGKFSVTTDGRVLLTGDEPPILDIYGPDAILMQTISLPVDMKNPRHAAETPSGNFVICHGEREKSPHRVCEVTKDGRLIRSYGGCKKGPRKGQLDIPEYVYTDADGRVYVSDKANRRVLVMDPTFSACRVLLSGNKDDIEYPRRLFYSHDTRRLIVGYNRDGHTIVDVYVVS